MNHWFFFPRTPLTNISLCALMSRFVRSRGGMNSPISYLIKFSVPIPRDDATTVNDGQYFTRTHTASKVDDHDEYVLKYNIAT